MIIFRMAWRNVWRHKVRSSIVMLAVTVGLFGGLASTGIMKGMVEDMVKNAIENQISDIQIHDAQYPENNEVRFLISNSSQLVSKIEKVAGVKAVCYRTKISGMASTASKATGVVVNGIDPDVEKRVTKIYTKLTDSLSSYFTSTRKNRMLISEKLAKELNAKIKSKIVITFQDYDGNLTGASFKVEGIYKTQNDMFDGQNIFVRKTDLDKLLNLPANSSHEMAVALNNHQETYDILPIVKEVASDYLVEGWFDIDPYLEMTSALTGYMLVIFMSIIMLALGFTIVNTMLMVVLERTKELGMIMAIGMNRKKIFVMIFYETLLLGLVGGILGIGVSVLFTQYFGRVGIDISSVAQGFEALGYSSVMHPYLEFTDYIQVIILVFITGLIASVFPTIRALKMKPVEAIRE